MALHLRGPSTGGLALFRLAERLLPAARDAASLLLVNDRVDVALAVGAHGAHLPGHGLTAVDARRLGGAGLLLGVSVHPGAAVPHDADFLLAGTLFPSASHPGRTGAGTAWLAALAAAGTPVIGIGGVAPERVAAVMRSGAWGVAAISGVWQAPDPAAAVNGYLQVIRDEL